MNLGPCKKCTLYDCLQWLVFNSVAVWAHHINPKGLDLLWAIIIFGDILGDILNTRWYW